MGLKREGSNGYWGVIDIHCHVLPGLDDGAGTPSETLAMLRYAADEGITDMIVTPHYRAERFTASPDRIHRLTEQAQRAADAEHIPVRLYPGNEVYYFDDMLSRFREKQLCTLNDTEYMLVEFSPTVLFSTVHNAMDSALNAGFRPIVAHAERYECLLSDRDNALLLHHLGVLLQVNAATVVGKNGSKSKQFAHRLLKENAVDFIGTDAHSVHHRAPDAAKCRDVIEKKFGEDTAYRVMRGNAEELLAVGGDR